MGLRPGKTRTAPWVGTGGGGGITADDLNGVYGYDSVWFDAGAIVPQESNGGISTLIHIPNSNKRRNAVMFEPSVDQYAYIYWPEHVGHIDWSSTDFRIRAFGSSDTNGSGLFIVLGFAVSNVYVSDDESDTGNFPFSAESTWTVDGRNDYDVWQGDTVGGSDSFSLPAPGGQSYIADSNTDINNISIRIARKGTDGSDDFTGNFYLYGIALQWANDFNNVHQWDL